MRAITRFWSAAAQAGLAEVAWHWLGPAWAFGLAVLLIAWHLPAAIMPASGAALEKARAVEHRLNALVAQIPAPQASPGPHSDSTYSGSNSSYGVTNSSYGASNSSYGASNSSYGVTNTSYGGHNLTNPQTGTQQGSGASHYHYTQIQADFNDLVASVNSIRDSHSSLIPAFNQLRQSHSDLVPAFNQLRDSHSDLVPAVNALRQSHSDLVPAVNALRDSHSNLVPLVNTLVGGHQVLTSKVNTTISRLETAGLFR